MVWKGKLTPNSQQISTPENNTPKDKTTIPQNEPDSPRVTEEPRHQQVNAPTDAVAMPDNRSQAAASSETPLNRLVLGNVSSARAVSAPDLVIPSAVSNIQNVPVQTAKQQNRNHLNLSSSVPGINTTSSYNHLPGRGNEPMLQQPQTTRPISEKGMFPFSKPKGKRKHTCNIDGNVYYADDRIINRIRDDLLEYGKTFQCICSLIQYYRSNKIPMASVNLGPRYHHNPPSPVYIKSHV
ncbi:hypothetical protein KUTeg_015226 [Tegillarca granosa]|uniref:Uncharacterized protein n=1 Tax=Tegillarca granosa TaxID=220873 RepID=A0ABQ9ET55_TEGGR|nr:hypothetical protein KUTeg_015226 [Tegillarca granosa]